jgi:hypothetical protein
MSISFGLCPALILLALMLCERPMTARAATGHLDSLGTLTTLQHEVAHPPFGTTKLTAPERSALESAESSLTFLHRHWTADTEASPAYVRSLLNDEHVLHAASTFAPARRQRAIFFVRDDVALKERHCRYTLARGGHGLGADLDVSVTTKFGGRIVKGYDIYWNWAFLVGIEQPTKLNRQSSPATGRVPAGLLLFWARKGKEDLMKDTQLPVHVGDGSTAFDLSVYE